MSQVMRVKYTGSTPAADGNTYVLFSTVVAFNGANMAQNAGMKRLIVDIGHAAAGTMNLYRSQNRGTTWDQVYTSGSIAAPASTASTIRDFAIEEYQDFKLEWVNGGSTQATRWIVDMSLTDQRAPLT